MAIDNYSLKRDGEKKLTTHFKVKEFACKDGSDSVIIDNNLICLLEKLRTLINKPITIVSGYRTISYNENIGGAENSYHCKGMACDIKANMDLTLLAILAGQIGFKGVGLYKDFIHIDTRENNYVWEVK